MRRRSIKRKDSNTRPPRHVAAFQRRRAVGVERRSPGVTCSLLAVRLQRPQSYCKSDDELSKQAQPPATLVNRFGVIIHVIAQTQTARRRDAVSWLTDARCGEMNARSHISSSFSSRLSASRQPHHSILLTRPHLTPTYSLLRQGRHESDIKTLRPHSIC